MKLDHPPETDRDLDVFLERIGAAPYVPMDEASHGTHEYYTWRARISRWLMKRSAFRLLPLKATGPIVTASTRL